VRTSRRGPKKRLFVFWGVALTPGASGGISIKDRRAAQRGRRIPVVAFPFILSGESLRELVPSPEARRRAFPDLAGTRNPRMTRRSGWNIPFQKIGQVERRGSGSSFVGLTGGKRHKKRGFRRVTRRRADTDPSELNQRW